LGNGIDPLEIIRYMYGADGTQVHLELHVRSGTGHSHKTKRASRWAAASATKCGNASAPFLATLRARYTCSGEGTATLPNSTNGFTPAFDHAVRRKKKSCALESYRYNDGAFNAV